MSRVLPCIVFALGGLACAGVTPSPNADGDPTETPDGPTKAAAAPVESDPEPADVGTPVDFASFPGRWVEVADYGTRWLRVSPPCDGHPWELEIRDAGRDVELNVGQEGGTFSLEGAVWRGDALFHDGQERFRWIDREAQRGRWGMTDAMPAEAAKGLESTPPDESCDEG